MPAPICLFMYKRPDHGRRTIDSLRANALAAESDLFVFCDGAKTAEDEEGVHEVRRLARTITGFRQLTIIERPANLGLAQSIISGVTDVVSKYGRTVVVEDDLVTSPFFLKFLNDGLDTYQDDAEVASIHGYQYPIRRPVPDTFFLRGTDCWGWATWQRAWQHFEPDGSKLLTELKARRLEREFDLSGSIGRTRLLRLQSSGRTASWAIRWHASAFLRNMLTLYPGRSLVQNIGFGAGATNCTGVDMLRTSLCAAPISVQRIPIEEHPGGRAAIERFFRRYTLMSGIQKISRLIFPRRA